MSRAHRRGRELRRKLGLRVRIEDAGVEDAWRRGIGLPLRRTSAAPAPASADFCIRGTPTCPSVPNC